MQSKENLRNALQRIDGRGYKAYKDIEGVFDFREYVLYVDHVQGDPFASPSRIRVRVRQDRAEFPQKTFKNKSREIGLRDYLARTFSDATEKFCRGNRGTGNSGLISIDRPGQEILERTSVFITDDIVEARFLMGLPAFGRRIAGRQAEDMFFEELPRIVESSLLYKNLNKEELQRHVETAEDTDVLRNQLEQMNLVAFVADGAVLPRASGVDPRPLSQGKVVPFESPESLRVQVELPNRGSLSGMGIPRGVTLIVGGGYHGKSTLLRALENGIYNHVPGDGREFVVTDPQAVKIRAEDGRRIEKVNISPFISNLPFGQETRAFSTDDASGSTSQAANTVEALEIGARALLIDEDTSATNFMIRDHRMQELVSKEKEPITPFIDKIRHLHRDLDVSTVLVIGGSGDYFDVADHVICMIEYKPYDFTAEAQSIADKYRAERKREGGEHFGMITHRIPRSRSFDPRKGKRMVKISAKGLNAILFGRYHIDLSAVEQLVDPSQTKAVGEAILFVMKHIDGRMTLKDLVDLVSVEIDKKGLDILSPGPVGDLAQFRGLELAAAINRLRTLSVNQEEG